jgi:hypothetical protein
LDVEWQLAAQELRSELQTLARLGEHYVIISTRDAAPGIRFCYVQVIFDNMGDAYAEAVSNFYLIEAMQCRDHDDCLARDPRSNRPLSPSEESTLLSLGWSPPGTLGGGNMPGRASRPDERRQAPHPPNFYRDFARQQGQRIIAETLLVTLNWVYGVRHPSDFTVRVQPSQHRRDRERMGPRTP